MALGMFLVAACVDAEQTLATRPGLPPCSDGPEIAVPVLDERASAAVDCLISSHASGDGAELEFTLLSDGQRHRAILQTLQDGRVNYFRQYPRGGWGFHVRCDEFRFPNSGVPAVNGCDMEYVPAGN